MDVMEHVFLEITLLATTWRRPPSGWCGHQSQSHWIVNFFLAFIRRDIDSPHLRIHSFAALVLVVRQLSKLDPPLPDAQQ